MAGESASEVINADRLYLKSPCTSFWETPVTSSASNCCVGCGSSVELPVRVCRDCFLVARSSLEASQPADFGSIAHWEGSLMDAEISDVAEWFVGWNEIENSLRQIFIVYLL